MSGTETQAHMLLGTHTEAPRPCVVGNGEVIAFTRPCPSLDPGADTGRPNQDSAAVLAVDSQRTVVAVADGVGGTQGGRDASKRALEVFARVVTRGVEREDDLREAILDGFEAANKSVNDLGTAGYTTLAVASIEKGKVRCYHVGDSAILVVGQRGRLRHLTIAHSPVGYAVESGLLDEDDAMTHAERNVVSNVLGTSEMKIEIGPKITLAARDTVLVASDGVFDNLSTDELIEGIRVGPLARVAKQLAARCEARMTTPEEGQPSKPDDTTFVLYRGVKPKRRAKPAEVAGDS